MLGGHTEARFLTELAGLGNSPSSGLSGKKLSLIFYGKTKMVNRQMLPVLIVLK